MENIKELTRIQFFNEDLIIYGTIDKPLFDPKNIGYLIRETVIISLDFIHNSDKIKCKFNDEEVVFLTEVGVCEILSIYFQNNFAHMLKYTIKSSLNCKLDELMTPVNTSNVTISIGDKCKNNLIEIRKNSISINDERLVKCDKLFTDGGFRKLIEAIDNKIRPMR